MTYWILLFLISSTCLAQQSTQIPIYSLEQPEALQAIQQAMDTKFSVKGGTISGTVSITNVVNLSTISAKNIVADTGQFNSSVTVPGGYFSIAGTTVVVVGGRMGIGVAVATPTATLDVLQGNERLYGIAVWNRSNFTASTAGSWTNTNNDAFGGPYTVNINAQGLRSTSYFDVNTGKTDGTGTSVFRAWSAGGSGFGTGATSPASTVDISGNSTIGSAYAGVNAAPANGLLVQGNVGIGQTTAPDPLDVTGKISATGNIATTGSGVFSAQGNTGTSQDCSSSFNITEGIRYTGGIMIAASCATKLPSGALPSTVAYTSVDNNFTVGQTLSASTLTVGGNAFSVGGSTFSVNMGTVSVGGVLMPTWAFEQVPLSVSLLQSTTPIQVGISWYCTNCTVSAGCVSTGTALGQVSDWTSRTTQCK